MCVIYFDRQSYRRDMHDPHDPSRCHAMCRRLTGVPSGYRYPDGKPKFRPTSTEPRIVYGSLSPWYGAHYYAACAVTSREGPDKRERWAFWRRAFAREVYGEERRLSGGYLALWRLAAQRVKDLWPEASKLGHSMLW